MPLQENMSQTFQWINGRDKVVIILLKEMDKKIGTLVVDALHSKHPNPKFLSLDAYHTYATIPTLINLDIMPDIVEKAAKTM